MTAFGIDALRDLQNLEVPEVAEFEGGIFGKPAAKAMQNDFDFEEGIFTLGKVKEEMLDSFRNGTPRGETTNIPQVDPNFTWRRGELTGVTGWPQHGKSIGTLFLMLLKSVYDSWRWLVFCPENYPARAFYDELIHSYVGITVDPKYPRMNEAQYLKAMEFVTSHFIYIYPKQLHTPDMIRQYFDYTFDKYGPFDGALKDPWNKMLHSFTGREDLYLQNQFPIEQRWARERNACSVITAHPSGKVKYDAEGLIICPDQFDISGGNMWNNMFDNILAWNRPEYKLDKASCLTEFHSHKIKIQKLVGIPGVAPCIFNRSTNRYEFEGTDPMVRPGVQHGYQACLVIPDPDSPKKLIPLEQAEKMAASSSGKQGGFDDAPPF